MTRAAGEEREPGKMEPGKGRGTETSQKEWVGGGSRAAETGRGLGLGHHQEAVAIQWGQF